MPSKTVLKRRGGVLRVRRKSLGRGRYIDIYVTRNPGKHGGRTLASPVHQTKRGNHRK